MAYGLSPIDVKLEIGFCIFLSLYTLSGCGFTRFINGGYGSGGYGRLGTGYGRWDFGLQIGSDLFFIREIGKKNPPIMSPLLSHFAGCVHSLAHPSSLWLSV
jgi:hypothetical protein